MRTPRLGKPRLVKGKQYQPSKGAIIIQEARQHLERATCIPEDEFPPSKRWALYLEKMRRDIRGLETTRDVIFNAHSRNAFDHRNSIGARHPHFEIYEALLKNEFPHFSDVIDRMADSPYSWPETLFEYQGRLVSQVFFVQLRFVLQCLTYVNEPQIVCEIGGGYGGPALLWLQNPVHRPDVYVLVDFPEVLFFAEVFLRVNVDDLQFVYITESTPLDPQTLPKPTVVLCPIKFVDSLSPLFLSPMVWC